MPAFHRPPVSSRAALTEIERQRRRLDPSFRPPSAPEAPWASGASGGAVREAAADTVEATDKKKGASGGEPKKKGDTSKGSGQKDDVQRKPEDQKGRANPTEGEGRGAY